MTRCKNFRRHKKTGKLDILSHSDEHSGGRGVYRETEGGVQPFFPEQRLAKICHGLSVELCPRTALIQCARVKSARS